MLYSYIIPTLNELKNVPLVLDLIENASTVFPHDYEIIFVDDRSTDGTAELIHQLAIKSSHIKFVDSPSLKGLGNAIKLGMQQVTGDYILLLDCDVSIRKDDLVKLLSGSGPDKMLIGSRYIRGGKIIGAPLWKAFFSRCLNWLISRFLKISAIDISHSLRIFPTKILPMPTHNTHPAFFWELSILAAKRGLKIAEIPITFRERLHGKSKNTIGRMLKSVTASLKTLIQIRKV